jgi:hypothetical protein
MSATLILTGLLPFVLLFGAVLAVPTSLVLLKLYRSAVQRGMRSVGGASNPTRAAVHRVPSSSLQLQSFDQRSSSTASETFSSAYHRAIHGRWRTAAVYTAAGACYALIMTVGWLMATRDPTIVWVKVLLLFWTYLWAAVLAIVLVAAYDRARRLQVFAAYFLVLLVIMAIAIFRNPGMGLGALPLYWLLTNGPPTVLVLAALLRPIRAVGPLVLAYLTVVGIGSQALLSLAAANEGVLRTISGIAFRLDLGARTVFAGMILLGMLAFGLLGWPLLRYLGHRYERRKLSDQSITIDASWLVFAVVQSIGLAFEAPPWILTGLVAFLGYKLVCTLAFGRVQPMPGTGEGSKLLQLRVFALGKRSERLFDRLRTHWQYAGSISMIAGPDLVTSTVEPHEFLDFVRGRLGRQFVTGADDLSNRMAAIETTPDPDGRYRINEFFCRADTWQVTMERLASTSDVVLMDLRSFSPANRGCIFELGRLLDGVDLGRVVLLVDDTTDRRFLEATLHELWHNLSADSPNQRASSPTARLFSIARQSEGELQSLLRVLMPDPPLSPPLRSAHVS